MCKNKKRTFFFQKTKNPEGGAGLLLKGLRGASVTKDSDFFGKRVFGKAAHGEKFFSTNT